jgi:hypothetical protein
MPGPKRTHILASQVIEGLKWLCYELPTVVKDDNAKLLAEYTKDAELLVSVLTDKVAHTFAQEHISTRLCKYVLNTLMQVNGEDMLLMLHSVCFVCEFPTLLSLLFQGSEEMGDTWF